jgi:flagellar biosynthesis/type III secretory pathway chaperone
MMKLFNGLLSILEEQTLCYEKIYEIKEREQDFLVKGDYDGLRQNNEEVERLYLSVRNLEKARLEIMEGLSEKFGLSDSEMTFERIIEFADEDSADALEQLAGRLVEVIQRTSRINEGNAYLIHRSAEWVSRWMDILTGLTGNKGIYSGDGRRSRLEDGATVVLDRQV